MTRTLGRTMTLAAAVLAVAACLPASRTVEGDAISALYDVALYMGIGVAVVIWGLLVFVIVRYRQSPRRPELPAQTHGHFRLELVWTAVPLAIVGLLFVLTVAALNVTAAPPTSAPLELRANAFRWGWRFEYPQAQVSVEGYGDPGPEVVLPVGRPIAVTLTATDVVHAWFVPQFLYKRDAIPGRENSFPLTIHEPGTYGGVCAEFCGLLHARMPFSVRAVDGAEFDTWLAARQAAATPGTAPAASP